MVILLCSSILSSDFIFISSLSFESQARTRSVMSYVTTFICFWSFMVDSSSSSSTKLTFSLFCCSFFNSSTKNSNGFYLLLDVISSMCRSISSCTSTQRGGKNRFPYSMDESSLEALVDMGISLWLSFIFSWSWGDDRPL